MAPVEGRERLGSPWWGVEAKELVGSDRNVEDEAERASVAG